MGVVPVANPSKVKGTTWEVSINNFNKAFAHLAGRRWVSHRNPPAGTVDVGDVELVTERLHVVIEAKAEKRIDLASYMKELAVEKANYEKREGHEAHGVVVVKRRNHPVERAYAVMEYRDFLQLIATLEAS